MNLKLVLLVLAIPLVFCEEADEKDVLVLKEDTFDSIVNREELMLVEFYAPWCGHCKALTPEYAKAATILKKNDPPIPLAKVDATVEGKLASRFSVNGYPTLFVFRNGKESPYKGPRKADGIVSYMKKQVGPAAKPLETKEQIEKFTKADDFVVVGFFTKETSQLKSSFLVLANKLRDNFNFGKVANSALFSEYGVQDDSIVVFKNYDEGKVIYSGSSRTSEVEAWINQHSLPVVGEFKESNSELYAKRGLPLARLFAAVDWKANAKQSKYYINRLKKAADEFQGKILIAYANKANFEREVNDYNLQNDEIGFVLEHQGNKYRMEDKFSTDNVLNFLRDYSDGKLKKYVRSERIPADNNGPVKTVVGLNFDDIVTSEKDVLLEFYAPWCGHCKSLAPKYEELGKKFQGVDSVVIAKIDATANDFDRQRFEVSGYPTIYFIPAKKDAKPIKYDGEREVEAMYKFVKKNAKKKISKK